MATRPVRKSLADTLTHWNGLLYADSGTGKTVFAGQDNKILFLAPESDDGLMSAQTMGSSAEHIEGIKQYEDVVNAYEWYDENPDELKDVNVLVIDSISELQYLIKDYVLRMTAEEKRRKGQDPTKLQIQDYGTMHELLEMMVRGINDLQVNVLWTATAKKVADADKNEFLVPDLQGKKDYGVSMKIVSLMTFYGYMRVELHDVPSPTPEDPKAVKKVKRRVIYWEDSGTIRGKDRTNALKPFTINATLQQVRLAIKGTLTRAVDGRLVKPSDAQKISDDQVALRAAQDKAIADAKQTKEEPEKVESSDAPGDPDPVDSIKKVSEEVEKVKEQEQNKESQPEQETVEA